MSIYMHSKIKTKNTLGEKIWIYCAKTTNSTHQQPTHSLPHCVLN